MKNFILKFNSFLIAIAIATASALSVTGAAQANSTSGSLAVTASVSSVCTLITTPVAFSSYNPTGTGNVTGTGTLSVACTMGTVISNITLGASPNGVSGAYARSMLLDAGADLLGYDLFTPANATPGAACAYTTKWDATASIFVPATAPSNAARVFNVCGQTAQGQNVSAGSYSDSIAVIVNY